MDHSTHSVDNKDWIVRDMGEEGKNINAYHWTEYNGLGWTKKQFGDAFEGTVLYEDDDVKIEFSNVKKITGHVTITNRKRRIGAFYELEVEIEWVGELKKEGKTEKGKIEIPDIGDENDPEEFSLRVSVDDGGLECKKCILNKNKGDVGIRQRISKIVKGIRAGAGMKTLPTSNSPNVQKKKVFDTAPDIKAEKTKSGGATGSLSLSESFVAPPGHIFDCFVNPSRIQAYTNSKAEISDKVGSKFFLFNGTISGEMISIEPGKRIVQRWRFSDWEKDHYSTVTLDFTQDAGRTMLSLKQTDIPEDQVEKLKQGWKQNFFVRIKGVFGYGVIGR